MSNILVTSLVLFNYFPRNTGSVQSFVIPKSGTYKLECWGASGGDDTRRGGYGGYSSGNLKLVQGEILYIISGGRGGSYAPTALGGYNGGGSAGGVGSSGGGGGATCITKANRGLLSAFASYKSDVYLVAGGGGGGGGGESYQPIIGGTGGGTGGGAGYNCAGGTQTSGYAFGQGQNCGTTTDGGGGGGGWYGGYAATADGGGAGGSGYIGGVLNGSMVDGVCTGDGHSTITQISF